MNLKQLFWTYALLLNLCGVFVASLNCAGVGVPHPRSVCIVGFTALAATCAIARLIAATREAASTRKD